MSEKKLTITATMTGVGPMLEFGPCVVRERRNNGKVRTLPETSECYVVLLPQDLEGCISVFQHAQQMLRDIASSPDTANVLGPFNSSIKL